MTATVVVAEDDGSLDGRLPSAGSFVDSLVVRLHTEYGVDPQVIRRGATEVLATFAGARVQAFVPILVEKTLRQTCRALRDAGGPPPSDAERDGSPNLRAVAGRPRR